MEKSSPGEVLRKHCKWIEASKFVELVAKKIGKSERWAKKLISDAYKDKQIKKHVFQDRTVIYGLTEFGPPTISSIEVGNMIASGLPPLDVVRVNSEISELEKREKPPKTSEGKLPRYVPTKTYGFAGMYIPPVKDILKAETENNIRIVQEARRELRFFREPTPSETAGKLGCTPQAARVLLYELAPLTGWKEQAQEQAQKEAEDAINLAGWRLWEKKGEQDPMLKAECDKAKNQASADVYRRAEAIVQNYPDLVPILYQIEPISNAKSKRPTGKGVVTTFPQINLTILQWPEKTKAKWQQIFKCKPPPPTEYWSS